MSQRADPHMQLPMGHRSRWIPDLALAAVALAWTIAVATLATTKLANLHSNWAYDLAFFHNLLWNTVHGAWFVQTSSPHEASGLFQLHHTYPILVPLVPVYALRPQLSTLLFVQIAAVASASLPVARLARHGGAPPWAAAVVGGCFLLQAPLLMTALCDFRPIVLGIPLLLWTMALAYEDRLWPTLALGALAMTAREEMIYLVAAVGLALPLARRAGRHRTRIAIGLFSLAALYWLGVKVAGAELTYYFNLVDTSPTGSLALQPLEGREFHHLSTYLVPFGLAAVLAAPMLVPSLPVLGFLLLISPHEWADWAGVYGHHAAPVLASFGGAAAIGWGALLRRAGRWRRAALATALLVGHGAALLWLAPGFLRDTTGPRPGLDAAAVAGIHALVDQVPADAPAAADYPAMALLSGRARQLCTADFKMDEAERFPWSRPWFPPGFEDVDWLLFDARDDPALARAAADCGAFALAGEAAPYRLYRRVAPGGEDCSDALRGAQGATAGQLSANSSGQ